MRKLKVFVTSNDEGVILKNQTKAHLGNLSLSRAYDIEVMEREEGCDLKINARLRRGGPETRTIKPTLFLFANEIKSKEEFFCMVNDFLRGNTQQNCNS